MVIASDFARPMAGGLPAEHAINEENARECSKVEQQEREYLARGSK